MHGIFIQPAVKEFKQAHGFDEANFPFDDAGGPQKGKLAKHGYIYKYWVGKVDNSYKMRKFYKENGFAIFVVFRDATSPSLSPSASSEIKVDTEPVNKKPRVGGKRSQLRLYDEPKLKLINYIQATARSQTPKLAARYHHPRGCLMPNLRTLALTPITMELDHRLIIANNQRNLLAQIITTIHLPILCTPQST